MGMKKKKLGRPRSKSFRQKYGDDAVDLVAQNVTGDPEDLTEKDFLEVVRALEREKGIRLI